MDIIDGYIINVNKAKKNNSRIYINIYKLLRIRIRIVYFGIMRYTVYMYMQKKYICSNTFLETELWLTATGIRIPYITVAGMFN